MIEKRPSFNSKIYRNVYSRRCDIEFLSHQTVQFRVQLCYIYMCSVVVLEVLLRHGLDFMNSDAHLALAASSTVVNVEVRRHLEAKIAQVISSGSFDVDAVYVVPDSDEELQALTYDFLFPDDEVYELAVSDDDEGSYNMVHKALFRATLFRFFVSSFNYL